MNLKESSYSAVEQPPPSFDFNTPKTEGLLVILNLLHEYRYNIDNEKRIGLNKIDQLAEHDRKINDRKMYL
jgi:hypothetical protein